MLEMNLLAFWEKSQCVGCSDKSKHGVVDSRTDVEMRSRVMILRESRLDPGKSIDSTSQVSEAEAFPKIVRQRSCYQIRELLY